MSVIALTGGAGYIGSHAALRLLRGGRRVLIIDDCRRGQPGAVAALRLAAGRHAGALEHAPIDCGDADAVERALRTHGVEAVMHFAGLINVGESVQRPGEYYRVNTGATGGLLEACRRAGVERFVFSSTAAVYGEPEPDQIPIPEEARLLPVNPYGWSKLHVERMLAEHADAARAQGGQAGRGGKGGQFRAAMLRYFNVAGADLSGHLGEDHRPETHLIPIVLRCLLGLEPERQNTVSVFGDDYPTPDGTAVRDYVHVEDLVEAHVLALEAMEGAGAGGGAGTGGEVGGGVGGDGGVGGGAPWEGVRAFNVGLGEGFSVRQVIEAVRRATGMDPRVRIGPRRAGDPARLIASPARAMRELGWRPKVTSLDQIVASAWRWMSAHRQGYG
ncbi:MAG: UDP-glucose 4-epimerase GalE [Planctomyces sp.]|nr:UDP-glucose 4-epimerase GalE [Planctomyces sp.]